MEAVGHGVAEPDPLTEPDPLFVLEAVGRVVNDAELHADLEVLLDPEGLGALVVEPTSVEEWLADAVILAKDAVTV